MNRQVLNSRQADREAFFRALQTEFSGTPFERHTLRNGVRLVHQTISSPVAYCALMVNTGSRDELKNEFGAAHLTEHLIFKETGKRKAHHILSRMEDVGGELNAYTTKEETCIHATFLNRHYARALELFADIAFNHQITDRLVQLERNVVIDEIKSTKDNPSELIFDEFDGLLFPDHPLGHSTLGTVQSVNRLDKAGIEQFVSRTYLPCQMVLSSVGNISFERFAGYAEKYFEGIVTENQPVERVQPGIYIPFEKTASKRNHQSHCIFGVTCGSTDRKFRIGMSMLAHLLGGTGMNNRLNMSLREKNGWVYHVEASYTPYSDTGVFNIYFAADKTKVEKCVTQIGKELNRLKNEPLSAQQLKKLQLQTMGQLAIASDSNDARVLSAGKSILMFNCVDSLHDICMIIDNITVDYLRETANSVFEHMSSLTYH